MTSLNANVKQVFCLVRRQWLTATPEEIVRQRLLLKLTQELGFPLSHIVVEISLRQMPHLRGVATVGWPDRRADILCYARNMSPLLLVECKAVALTSRVLRQTTGYNQYVKASYLAVANQTQERLGRYDHNTGVYHFLDALASYSDITPMSSK